MLGSYVNNQKRKITQKNKRFSGNLERYNDKKKSTLHHDIRTEGKDILESINFRKSEKNMQHGNVSVRRHSIQVAKYSLLISSKLGIKCNKRDLIRGALLHDYFLYDWHDNNHVSIHKLHGFYHPGVALTNAKKEYELTKKQQDIIKKHMWPLTVVPPVCKEAWIVSMADKYCSLMETARLHQGSSRDKSKKVNWNIFMKKFQLTHNNEIS